jgi:hypothetical protein
MKTLTRYVGREVLASIALIFASFAIPRAYLPSFGIESTL